MSLHLTIEKKLLEHLAPEHLEVVNESSRHNVPVGSETHFKAVIVSHQFDGKRLINRHRQVNALLAQELANDVHALALHTYTPDEWRHYYADIADSPRCMGGHA